MTNFGMLVVNSGIVALFSFIITEGEGIVKWINALFYVSALNIIPFLYLFIAKGRFFDGITRSFQYFMPDKIITDKQPVPSNLVNLTIYYTLRFNVKCLMSILIFLQVVQLLF